MYIAIAVVLWVLAMLWGKIGAEMGVITRYSHRWPDFVLAALVLTSIVTGMIGFVKLSMKWLA